MNGLLYQALLHFVLLHNFTAPHETMSCSRLTFQHGRQAEDALVHIYAGFAYTTNESAEPLPTARATPSIHFLARDLRQPSPSTSLSSHIPQSWPSSWFSVAPSRATLAGLHPSLPLSRSAFRIRMPRHSARLFATEHVLTAASPNMLLSGSRDKTLIIWNLTRDETSYGYPKRSLHGHSHIVSDCVRTPTEAHGSNWGADWRKKQQRGVWRNGRCN